jgi:hypothetical protein
VRSPRLATAALAVLGATAAAVASGGVFPAVAVAHGPVAPIASAYLARVQIVPAGVSAQVVDGDQRMWFSVASGETLIVLDYRGAPYLRFSRAGVAVNENSEMYYLNQTPAEVPPSSLAAGTPPKWSSVSSGHTYSWHDGRLHALATVALAPGASYVGRWTIPVRVDDGVSAVSGGLWHHNGPSIVWFWPILVLLACTLAARRARLPKLNLGLARGLALPALAATAVAAVGKQLHGRPSVSGYQLFIFAVLVLFVAWGLRQVLLRRPSYVTYFAIAFVSIYEGAQLVPTLVDGYVLAAVPAPAARTAAVLCLGCGLGLLLLPSRLTDPAADGPSGEVASGDPDPPAGVSPRESFA